MVDISNIFVNCSVHLGYDELTADDYEGLRIGDVILLDHQATDSLDLKVEGWTGFKVKPGLEGMHKAVVISDE